MSDQDQDQRDVVIVGGGPAGLSAALILGRACKRVLLADGGPPRNAAAVAIHGFVTHDGTPPRELRRIGREQLAPYDVQLRDERVLNIERGDSGLRVSFEHGAPVETRRVLLATGMVDVLPELPGYRDLWGHGIVQCPYCHGWEARGQRWGVLAPTEHMLDFARFVTGWTRDVVAFTDGTPVPPEQRERLDRSGVRVETARLRALRGNGHLEAVELEDGQTIPRELLLARPPQRQVELVARLGVALDADGFVRVDPIGQTSVPGILAAGDLTTPGQAAVLAASAGAMAAYGLTHALNLE